MSKGYFVLPMSTKRPRPTTFLIWLRVPSYPLSSQSCNLHKKVQKSCQRLVVQAVYCLHLLRNFREFLKFITEKESDFQQRQDKSSPTCALRRSGDATSLLLRFISKQKQYLNNHATSPAVRVSKIQRWLQLLGALLASENFCFSVPEQLCVFKSHLAIHVILS